MLDVRSRDSGRRPFGRQTAIIRHLELRRRLQRRRELQRLSPPELNLLDVRITDHFELLVFDSLTVRVTDELPLGLVLDVLLVFLEDHVARRFAGAKAGQGGLAHVILGHRLERRVHRLGIDLEAHQLFAGRQIFHRYIHKQTFPPVEPRARNPRL